MTDRFRHIWWGWGRADARFSWEGRPALRGFLARFVDDPDRIVAQPPAQVALPPSRASASLVAALPGGRNDDAERLQYACGRSMLDLIRLRFGQPLAPPDAVTHPADEDEVAAVLSAAAQAGAAVVPYGGGSNVVGACEHRHDRIRITLATDRLCRLHHLDPVSCTGEVGAGMFGPQVEEALAPHRFWLGHLPDSYEYSTVGGWIATRSAGTLSNAVGRIEDLVEGCTVVTPQGRIAARPAPACSDGPDWRRTLLGSEGAFGVITRANLRLRRLPEVEEYRVVLFRTFAEGIAALIGMRDRGVLPAMARLSDETETAYMMALAPARHGLQARIEAAGRWWLARRGFATPVMLLVGCVGSRSQRSGMTAVRAACTAAGGIDLGPGPARMWRKGRFLVGYLRDFATDHGLVSDSHETTVPWHRMHEAYGDLRRTLDAAATGTAGRPGYVGCHISHLYQTGACLYFLAAAQVPQPHRMESWIQAQLTMKAASLDRLHALGLPLAHHHAVGHEHAAHAAAAQGQLGMAALGALKRTWDPDGICNPGWLA